jgi:ATP-dependent DNA helicase RecG
MRASMREGNLPDPKFVQKQIGMFQVSVTLENDLEHRKLYVRSQAASQLIQRSTPRYQKAKR